MMPAIRMKAKKNKKTKNKGSTKTLFRHGSSQKGGKVYFTSNGIGNEAVYCSARCPKRRGMRGMHSVEHLSIV